MFPWLFSVYMDAVYLFYFIMVWPQWLIPWPYHRGGPCVTCKRKLFLRHTTDGTLDYLGTKWSPSGGNGLRSCFNVLFLALYQLYEVYRTIAFWQLCRNWCSQKVPCIRLSQDSNTRPPARQPYTPATQPPRLLYGCSDEGGEDGDGKEGREWRLPGLLYAYD